MSQVIGERLLIGTFCFQTLAIVLAEWVRPEIDYGLLAMHISYMNNFTPLPSIITQLVITIFGLLPYGLAKIMCFSVPSWNFMDWNHLEVKVGSREGEAICTQADQSTIEQLVISMAVPFILFLYQVLVTYRRDESMRWDSLFKHNLVRQQRMLADEQRRNEGMLKSMLPKQIITSLKAGDNIEPQEFPDATVIFVEICQFARLCCNLPPTNVVEVLNLIYHEFDRLSDLLHVYKVETVAQVYMAVVGAPDSITNHADGAAHFGLALSHSMEIMRPWLNSIIMVNKVVQTSVPGMCNGVSEPKQRSGSKLTGVTCTDEDLTFEIRIGINSGQLFAGVVGIDSPRYKLFGDTVNTASRMESTCEPGRIQVSPSTQPKLTKGMFTLQDRGLINVKGKGKMNTYYLTGYATAESYSTRKIVINRVMQVTHLAGISNSAASATRSPSGSNKSSLSMWNGCEDNLTRDCVPPLMCGRDGSCDIELTRDTTGHNHLMTSGQSSSRKNYFFGDALDMSNEESVDSETGLQPLGQILKNIGGEVWAENRGNLEHAKLSWSEKAMYFFLLVPASQKKPQWIAQLRAGMPLYLEYTHEKRLVFARQLTILMLFMLSVLWGIVDLLETDISANPAYANVMVARDWGHTFVGLLYLFAVSITTWSPRIEQMLTMIMLLVQGGTLLVTGTVLWDNEMSFVACSVMHGVYVLFFTVCSISQRLLVCSLAIASYVLMKSMMCSVHISAAPITALQNIGFLIFFIGSMNCSLWLQEHLSHIFHCEQRAARVCIDKIEQARTAGSQLLTNLLPPHVVSLVCNGTSPIAETHDGVTILFTDIEGFTKFSANVSPQKLCSVLNSMYSAFDEIIHMWELHKVEIIGDAYWVSAGCPPRLFNQDGAEDDEGPPRNRNHQQKEDDQEKRESTESEFAMRAVEVGLAMLRVLPSVCDDNNVQMRIGIHTGSIVAGVVGKKGPRYHLFGPAVAYAEQMESSGIPGRVQISDVTHSILERGGFAYDHEERAVEIDGEAVASWDDPPVCTWLVNKSNNREAIQIQQEFMEVRRRQSNRSYADNKP